MSSHELVLNGTSLTIGDVVHAARTPCLTVSLAADARQALIATRRLVDDAVSSGRTMYGINTGFGKLASVRIDAHELEALQLNLVRSHAAGVGDPLPAEAVRALMILRANVLARATSGVRVELIEALLAIINGGVVPWVPSQGSVGASGDLAPLAHVAMVLVGEGWTMDAGGQRRPAADALRQLGLKPFVFGPKEGISFINGTQAQTALLALLSHDALQLWETAVGAAAMSLEALRGTPTPLDPRIHAMRPHAGQLHCAASMLALLDESEIRESHRDNDDRVQDAYSLRCTPQVLGAVHDAIMFARGTAEIELNASTDNPLVFPNGDILSGGNFHGQPVAQALDVLAMTLVTLQAISERRIERLVNPDLSQGLPAFLTSAPGVSSGYMMVQITAAALVAESRTLAMPASIGSIPTDANQEDFVPMGMAAAYKCGRIMANAERVIAAELLCAAQGLELLQPLRPGVGVRRLHEQVRSLDPPVHALHEDRPPSDDLETLAAAVRRGELVPR